eukprot:m.67103 g.67103  ORF g.67103 m.67103 type:complete len:291 (-) comp23763_c0_seq1:161-1033(-)
MAEVLVELAAHVFQIDTKQRDKWISVAGPGAIPLEISRDTRTGKFAIVARDNQAIEVLRSPLQGDLKFTPTSAKFGQWTQNQDEGIVYGVGFQSEPNLESFSKAFAQGLLKGKAARVPDNNSGAPQGGKSDEALVQLKFENERLKIALGTSSANAKKWEQQLQTLKTNNSKLRTALQESASNVEEWKCQLTLWKDESTRFKKQCESQQQKLKDLEGKGGASSFEMQQLQQELRTAQQARDDLQQQLAAMQNSKSTVDDSTTSIMQIEQNLKSQLQQLATVRNRLQQINYT